MGAILRDLNTELMRRLANLSRKRPPSERLARLECQLQLPLPGLSDDEQRDQSLKGGRKKQRKRRKQKRPGRNPLPAHLERVEQLNPVPDEMRNCPICNKSMPVIGYETSESLDVRPAQLFVCVRKDECVGCQTHGVVVSAPPPNRIMPRGKLSDTFIVEALADKYLLHLPIERQCARWAQYGIDLAPNTLGRSVAAAIDLLGPVASGIIEQGRASEIFSGDATGLRVLDPEAPEAQTHGDDLVRHRERPVGIFLLLA